MLAPQQNLDAHCSLVSVSLLFNKLNEITVMMKGHYRQTLSKEEQQMSKRREEKGRPKEMMIIVMMTTMMMIIIEWQLVVFCVCVCVCVCAWSLQALKLKRKRLVEQVGERNFLIFSVYLLCLSLPSTFFATFGLQ